MAGRLKQFDVCSATGVVASRRGRRRLVVVLQHHDVEALATVVVAPLFLPSELDALERLRPSATVSGRVYIVAVDRLASLPKRQIGPPSDNLEVLRYELTKALDLLFSGF
jgi:hypothetical protein